MKSNKVRIAFGEWSAIIDVDRGANCVSLRNDLYKAHILREPPESGELDNPYLYGMPLLFPVNRIEGGRFDFEGREYVFPINEPRTGCHLHGELHRAAFETVEQSDRRLVCRYVADKGEYLGFPHAFEIIQEYELKEDGFYHTVTVLNKSYSNMPVFIGFHTTFNSLFSLDSSPEDIRVLAQISEEYERNMEVNYLPTGVKPPFDGASLALCQGEYKPFERSLSRHYRAGGEGRMSITDVKRRLRVVYENDSKYGFRLIYNGGAEGYICLEPQNCLANCQNSPFSRAEGGFDAIEAGGKRIYRSKINLENF